MTQFHLRAFPTSVQNLYMPLSFYQSFQSDVDDSWQKYTSILNTKSRSAFYYFPYYYDYDSVTIKYAYRALTTITKR